jgi:hypothetical protein
VFIVIIMCVLIYFVKSTKTSLYVRYIFLENGIFVYPCRPETDTCNLYHLV